MLAFNINDGGAGDAEWPMRKQVWHVLWKKLCRFDIERKELLVHGAMILHGNTVLRSGDLGPRVQALQNSQLM